MATMNFGQRMAAARAAKGGKKGAKKAVVPPVMPMKGQMPMKPMMKKKGKKKNWIAGAIGKPGALHRQMGVKQGEKIPKRRLQAAAGKKGLLGRRARLAETLAGFNKGKKKPSAGAKAYLKRVGMKGC